MVISIYSSQNDLPRKEYIRIEGPAIKSFYLPAGKYKVTCYGAEGGYSFYDGKYASPGGKGAMVSAYIEIEGKPQLFHAFVGGMGGSRVTGIADGGFNGGGSSGWNKKWKAHHLHNKQYKNGPGGGGGATDLRIGTTDIMNRIIVASGGSGACAFSPGAPGGTLNGYNIYGISSRTNQYTGNSYGIGANGITAKHFPSSGSGGGYFGGAVGSPSEVDSNIAVSDSGSSYISGYPGCSPHPKITLSSGEMTAGYKLGHGLLIIEVIYQCPDNCLNCKGENQCTKCDQTNRLYDGLCFSTCPTGTIDRNYYCEKCDESCSECSETATNCTICADNYFQYNDMCVLKCPEGTFEYENQCLKECKEGTYANGSFCSECSDLCKDCVDDPEKCTSCPYDKYLLKGKCVDSCPDRYVIQGNVCIDECDSDHFLYQNVCYNICPKGTYEFGQTCEKCDSSCDECRDSATSCTACSNDKYLFNSQCIQSCSEDYFIYHGQCLINCPPKTFIIEKNCVDYCPEGKYGINQICNDCDSSCAACKNTPTTCTKCKNNKYLYDNQCVDECIDGLFIYSNECVNQCPPGTQLKNKICINSMEYYNQTQTIKKRNKFGLSKQGENWLFSVTLFCLLVLLSSVITLCIKIFK